MLRITQSELHIEEEGFKELVYKTLDDRIRSATSNVEKAEHTIKHGLGDGKTGFHDYAQRSEQMQALRNEERLVRILYDSPYFAHVRTCDGADKRNHEEFLLSDREGLDETVALHNDINDAQCYLIPFKQDESHPLFSALFHCYMQSNGKRVYYGRTDETEFSFIPEYIRDVEILNREIIRVAQKFPQQEEIDFDELLDEMLEENRRNPELQNIIRSLQLSQFEIIQEDADKSFIIQGCAGSGKSQCLIHRLFFLRDALSDKGWDKVLLLTPTKLFRQYAANLMKRYRLTDILDCSVADLYHTLLDSYDDRFRDRQYIFCLSEEYLPAEYIRAVYAEDNIASIRAEIENAIEEYVLQACNALNEDFPDSRITKPFIRELLERLDEQLEAFDERQKKLSNDQEYIEKSEEHNQLAGRLGTLRKTLAKAEKDLSYTNEKLGKLKDQYEETVNARKELEEWKNERNNRLEKAKTELKGLAEQLSIGEEYTAAADYARQLFRVRDMVEGDAYKRDEDYLAFLSEYLQNMESDLENLAEHKKPEALIEKGKKRVTDLSDQIDSLRVEIQEAVNRQEELQLELQEKNSEYANEKDMLNADRTEMQHAKYYLTRIESAVFEKEVWDALMPLKEKYNVSSVVKDVSKDGKNKESRILYKSDLMFYIRIYQRLNPFALLPEYQHICIDEGQDLQKADYDLLHDLFPDSVFNVFGDTNQVLNQYCGITDWRRQTGIDDIRILSKNYRNPAAITSFCNKKFNVKMEYIGKVREEQKPVILRSVQEIKSALNDPDTVLIVKDRTVYDMLCRQGITNPSVWVFTDTTVDQIDQNTRICYSIFAAKGLEFSRVLVYASMMTQSQKVVACTRAMERLYYYE